MSALHISFSAEPVFHVGSLAITNSILTSVLVSTLLLAFAVAARKSINTTGKPSRFQTFVEMIIETLNNLVIDVAGKGKKHALFAPIIMTFFLFILTNNWLGLLPGVGTIGIIEKDEQFNEIVVSSPLTPPVLAAEETTDPSHTQEAQAVGQEQEATDVTESEEQAEVASTQHSEGKFVPLFRAGTADLNTTIALALISVSLTQIFGVKFLGLSYFKKYINISNPMAFFVGILELVSEFSKIISFAFRLFGNIFAGEVLLAVISFLIPIIAPMPFYGLEIFVGFIQALVFAMLSLVFFNIATIGHGEEH